MTCSWWEGGGGGGGLSWTFWDELWAMLFCWGLGCCYGWLLEREGELYDLFEGEEKFLGGGGGGIFPEREGGGGKIFPDNGGGGGGKFPDGIGGGGKIPDGGGGGGGKFPGGGGGGGGSPLRLGGGGGGKLDPPIPPPSPFCYSSFLALLNP